MPKMKTHRGMAKHETEVAKADTKVVERQLGLR